jgi:hypothetical protein
MVAEIVNLDVIGRNYSTHFFKVSWWSFTLTWNSGPMDARSLCWAGNKLALPSLQHKSFSPFNNCSWYLSWYVCWQIFDNVARNSNICISDALFGNFNPSVAVFSYNGSQHVDVIWDPSFETTIAFRTIRSLNSLAWGSDIYPFDE